MTARPDPGSPQRHLEIGVRLRPPCVLNETTELRLEIKRLKKMNRQLDRALRKTNSALIHYQEIGLIPKRKL
jgi:hypothetical protein